MANKNYDLAHTKWMCKYHIVFTPKYRRKVIYNQLKVDIRDILKQLCSYKGVEIIEGHLMPDHIHTIDEYIGKFDVTDEELTIIKTELAKTIYDEYDRLIQLCDCLAGAEGVLDIENRMNDVKKRYGFYPQDKWNSNMNLKQYFEGKTNKDIYLICEKGAFAPGDL